MTLEIAILGCGSSAGVPRVGQGFGACDPHNPRNHRRRCSILVEKPGPHGATRVLVDAGPDVRMQLIDAGVDRLDALLLTHPHADHIHGLDDVRPLTMQMRRMIDCYLDAPTWDTVGHRFAYLFKTPSGSAYPPLLVPHLVAPGAAVAPEGPAGALEALPFRLNHGDIDALGYRFENVAYTPDVKAIPDESSEFLEDLDLWIIDALRYRDHPTHFSLGDALDMIARFKPKRAVLTNMHTDMDYEVLRGELPEGVEPAFDGMRLAV